MPEAHFHDRIEDIDARAWDRLRPDDNPFLAHAWLALLEDSGTIRRQLGWQPMHLALYEGERLIGAAPVYLKANSHGEFVFDWAWAQALHRAGLPYYPKLLSAVPYTPVTGPRLLSGRPPDPAIERALLSALWRQCRALGLSGVHINFPLAEQAARLASGQWLARFDWQYHWRNPGWRDFADFLDALKRKKRKNIVQERQKLAALDFQVRRGSELSEAEWAEVHALYCLGFIEKGNTPALTRAAFIGLGGLPGDPARIVLARRGRELIAMALSLAGGGRLYGRYWGCRETLPGLHFETCYYQGIELCLREGLTVFEPGAQGEHKIARGFLPVRVYSLHRLAHPGLHRAVAEALRVEAAQREALGTELARLSPFSEPLRCD